MARKPLLNRLLPIVGFGAIAVGLFGMTRAGAWSVRFSRMFRGEFPGMGTPLLREGVVPALAVTSGPNGVDSVRFKEGKAVILVYDARCSVCNSNAPRWLDLVVEAHQRHPDARIYGLPLTREPISENARYWRKLRHIVSTLDPVEFAGAAAVAGGTATPLTVVIKDGKKVASHIGYLGERRRRYLLQALDD